MISALLDTSKQPTSYITQPDPASNHSDLLYAHTHQLNRAQSSPLYRPQRHGTHQPKHTTMSSQTSQPYTYDPQPQPQYQAGPQPLPQQQQMQTALMPHPRQSSSYNNAPQHLAPYDPYSQQQAQQFAAAPQPSRRHSSQSQRSHHSHHSRHSERSVREREIEKRPSLGDTAVLIWDSILGAFSRRR